MSLHFTSTYLMGRTFDNNTPNYRSLPILIPDFHIYSNSSALKTLLHIFYCGHNCILTLPADEPCISFSNYFYGEICLLYPHPNNNLRLEVMDRIHFSLHLQDLTIISHIMRHYAECLELYLLI